jgi:adenosine deaminase
MMNETIDVLRQLKKSDLHCHLDGSMRAETILDVARNEKIDLKTTDVATLRSILLCGRKVSSLPEFLRAFDITCSVLQSREAIERVAFELAEDAAKENVRILEVRYAPVLSTNHGLTMEEVVEAMQKGLKRAQAQYAIRTGIILCALRNRDPNESIDLANLAVGFKRKGVVGFDLAQAEHGNPAGKHAEAFRIASRGGLGITVHAGEDFGPESIRQAIDDCGATRIGHGLTLWQDRALEKRVIDSGIVLECCPSSNVQINLIPTFADHPLKGYLERGVKVTLNTDNRLLTGITVTDEYIRAHTKLGLTLAQLTTIADNGQRAAF